MSRLHRSNWSYLLIHHSSHHSASRQVKILP
jgi:hypothetical protein